MTNKITHIFIPEIGTKIKLINPWIFHLYDESRNRELLDIIKSENLKKADIVKNNRWDPDGYIFSLPTETILTVKRVYLRQGLKNFSSVSFNINQTIDPFLAAYKQQYKKGKTISYFWAKLSDVNRIQCEVLVDPSVPGYTEG